MTWDRNSWKRTIGATLVLVLALGWAAAARAQCVYPKVTTFGLVDNFSMVPPADPIPYNPAMPSFVSFLNMNGVSTANMKTFDDPTPNRYMVATLRHGLGSCFAGANFLIFCMRARAHDDGPGNDTFNIFNSNLSNSTFTGIYSNTFAAQFGNPWTLGTTATVCVDLTTQMMNGDISDVLQLSLQDDTAIDYIKMTLYQ